MPVLHITLNIPADHFLEWYRGTARVVRAASWEGQTVQFPASILQRYVTKEGVHGDFRLTFDDRYRFVRMEKLSPLSGLDRYG